MKIPYITTTDNPYDPANEFRQWYEYDVRKGYCTIDLLGRLYTGGPHQSDPDNDLAREQAIFEIASENITGMYTVVYSDE